MAHTCLVVECDLPKKTLGYCSKHYWRLWKNGDPLKENKTKHGMTNSKEWRAWHGMKNRCFCVSKENHRYRSRGIVVCDGWRNSFEAFYGDVGDAPSPAHSIDRINNDGNYSCGNCAQCRSNGWVMNCRWATQVEQGRNRSSSRMITINNETKCLGEWAEILNVPHRLVRKRISRGWSIERAFNL